MWHEETSRVMMYLDNMFELGCCVALSVCKVTTGTPTHSHIVVSEGFTVAVMEEISDGRGERGRRKENMTEVPH